MLSLSPRKERKKRNCNLKVCFEFCSNGLGDVAARGETVQAFQPETAFVTERRGSDVEQTTSEDDLDREFLALCGRESSRVLREPSECTASNAAEAKSVAAEEKPTAVAQEVDATVAVPVGEQAEENTPEAVESPAAEETGESSPMTPKACGVRNEEPSDSPSSRTE